MSDRVCCENRIAYPTNCKNCGAPLHGSRCEFCGTEYNFVSGLEAKFNELKFRTANTLQIANIKFGTPIGYKINSDGATSDCCEGIENCPKMW